MKYEHLLIVDDDMATCNFLREIGESCGYNVSVSNDVEAFHEAYTLYSPSFIILDLNLGESDGIELLRLLALKKCKSQIVLISGHDKKVLSSAVFLGRSENIDVLDALEKPIDIAKITALLQSGKNTLITPSVDQLLSALDEHNFVLYYQPKISIIDNSVIGVEALIRWIMPRNCIISPESFITIAEESGLIKSITEWVNVEAIKQCAKWHQQGIDLTMSVNLSAKVLTDLALPDELFRLCKEYNIPTNQVCLEITETAAMSHPNEIMDVLTRFRIKGFSVSIDDFGTGYSSLVELQRMPFNELKIDRSFIMALEKNTSEYIIVRSSINLAHDLGLKVVAEGVENPQTLALLKSLGCDIGQGYYFAKPMPADLVPEWLAKYNAGTVIAQH